jgi:DNA repair exonuclease SbcCD ATPase subunit
MINLPDNIRKELIELGEKKGITLEGNIAKLFESTGDDTFKQYLDDCINRDREHRKRRLEITKQIQIQNKELTDLNSENEKMVQEVQETLKSVEESKQQIELQNRELISWKEDNQRISLELQEAMRKSETARIEAENAKRNAENDLDVLQKKTQYELINTIVKSSLGVIISIGVLTTLMYLIALFNNKDTQIISTTWSNMFGILLTNSFSIVGTIMGVKYASQGDGKN